MNWEKSCKLRDIQMLEYTLSQLQWVHDGHDDELDDVSARVVFIMEDLQELIVILKKQIEKEGGTE